MDRHREPRGLDAALGLGPLEHQLFEDRRRLVPRRPCAPPPARGVRARAGSTAWRGAARGGTRARVVEAIELVLVEVDRGDAGGHAVLRRAPRRAGEAPERVAAASSKLPRRMLISPSRASAPTWSGSSIVTCSSALSAPSWSPFSRRTRACSQKSFWISVRVVGGLEPTRDEREQLVVVLSLADAPEQLVERHGAASASRAKLASRASLGRVVVAELEPGERGLLPESRRRARRRGSAPRARRRRARASARVARLARPHARRPSQPARSPGRASTARSNAARAVVEVVRGERATIPARRGGVDRGVVAERARRAPSRAVARRRGSQPGGASSRFARRAAADSPTTSGAGARRVDARLEQRSARDASPRAPRPAATPRRRACARLLLVGLPQRPSPREPLERRRQAAARLEPARSPRARAPRASSASRASRTCSAAARAARAWPARGDAYEASRVAVGVASRRPTRRAGPGPPRGRGRRRRLAVDVGRAPPRASSGSPAAELRAKRSSARTRGSPPRRVATSRSIARRRPSIESGVDAPRCPGEEHFAASGAPRDRRLHLLDRRALRSPARQRSKAASRRSAAARSRVGRRDGGVGRDARRGRRGPRRRGRGPRGTRATTGSVASRSASSRSRACARRPRRRAACARSAATSESPRARSGSASSAASSSTAAARRGAFASALAPDRRSPGGRNASRTRAEPRAARRRPPCSRSASRGRRRRRRAPAASRRSST